MKKVVVVIAIMAIVLFSAGFVLAGDVGDVIGDGSVGIGFDNNVTNTISNTNTNTNNLNQDQHQNQVQNQTQSAVGVAGDVKGGDASNHNNVSLSLVNEDKREFLASPRFVTGIVPGTIIEDKIYKSFCPTRGTFSADKINRMKRKFHFGDLFSWRKHVEVAEIEEPRNPVDFLTCQMEWPETYDGVGAEVWVGGDTDSTRAEAVGSAMAACIERGFPAIAIIIADRYEGVTSGKSLGLSSAISTVSDSSGVSHAAGGMIGSIKTRNDEYKIVRAMCLIPPTVVQAKSATPVTIARRVETAPRVEPKPVPAQRLACDPQPIMQQIEALENKFCPNLNYENFRRNMDLANLYIEAYVCTRDKTFLGKKYKVEETGVERNGAIGHFERAEKNLAHLKGKERENAKAEMVEANKNWATAINVVDGQKAANSFAGKKKTVFQQGFGQ